VSWPSVIVLTLLATAAAS